MRRKMLHKAKLIVKVESFKDGRQLTNNYPLVTIRTVSVYDTRTNKFWDKERIEERGIEYFLNLDDLKETLNWNTNGDSSKYQFVWGQGSKICSEGVAYIFD